MIYRRYAALFFILAVDEDEVCRRSHLQNELAMLEFIHGLVKCLDMYFESVSELDIMFNLEKAHIILDEMVADGQVVEMVSAHTKPQNPRHVLELTQLYCPEKV